MDEQYIRNFCIIAHIDHGKSTLSDRLLEMTGTLTAREMSEQVLDQMDLEREKGITIKAKAVRMTFRAEDGQDYELNLIDTPGHVDFTYEVSRALAACEGAVLVVDATQGIEAQTLSNLYLALEHDLAIVPVLNKIDLASAQPDMVAQEIEDLTGINASDVLRVSAKTGQGVEAVLRRVVEAVPPPKGQRRRPLRALIFDSHYDPYKGVIAYVRVFDGAVRRGDKLRLMAQGTAFEVVETGVFRPTMAGVDELEAGEVGYVATGLKTISDISVGDTITLADSPADEPVPGYRPVKPMVFAGLYPADTEDYGLLRDALEKLRLNDAALVYEPENSVALGFGFRCGFLGLLHMEIVQERLEREYNLTLVATAPSVEYHVVLESGEEVSVDNPAELPNEGLIAEIQEPWMKISVFTPADYVGPVMDLVVSRRGVFEHMEYLDEKRVLLQYTVPLSEIIVDFYDNLKSRTRGYASMDYTLADYRPADLVRLEVLVNEEPVDALSVIVHRDQAYNKGSALVRKLKEVIPPQLFTVPIQASLGSRVIARANVKALRKDVLAKCYGGDITRKRKLLEKQKEGKKRMKRLGRVEIPQEAFMAILSLEEG